ncbi:MAG TPA: IPTL-CTERM sorting domain-containing protein [Brevundimonas sp.]
MLANVPVGALLESNAISPDGARLYVADWISGNISVIDTSTNTVTATITGMVSPNDIAVSPEGARAYVTGYNTTTLYVIDTGSNAVTPVAIPGQPTGVAVTPDGAYVYVTNRANVIVVDTATNTIGDTIGGLSNPSEIGLTPTGHRAYVTNPSSSVVTVIDTATKAVVGHVSVGQRPKAAGPFIGPTPSSPPAAVPTMGEWAMILLGVVLAAGSALTVQRRRMAA